MRPQLNIPIFRFFIAEVTRSIMIRIVRYICVEVFVVIFVTALRASSLMPFKDSLRRAPLERGHQDPLLQQHIQFAQECIAPSLEDAADARSVVQCS